ncbi:MAG: hypothetical protein ACOCUH_04010, partial [Bacteriovoracia bacterium]
MRKTFFLIAIFFSFNLSAQMGMKNLKPCFGDLKRHCKRINPGKGAIIGCLISNEDKLTAECKKVVDKKKAEISKDSPCFEDVMKLCPPKERIKGKLQKCLEKNMAKLGDKCKQDFKEYKMKQLGGACEPDIQKYCSGKKKGGGELAKCIKEKEDKFSTECKDFFKSVRKKMAKNYPCVQDVKKFCSDVSKNVSKLHECMKKNEKKLSKVCQAKKKEIRDKKKNLKKACANDEKKYCKDAPAVGSAKILCLRQHKKKLSAKCRKLLPPPRRVYK